MKILPPILAGFAILLAVQGVRADLLPFGNRAPPLPTPSPSPPPVSKAAVLVIDATTTAGMRVVLPAALVKELQEAVRADTPASIGRLPWSSIMVGAALSCALACVGLGMVRSQRRMTFAALFCLTGATLFASLGCPQSIIPDNPVTDKVHKEREERANGVLEGVVQLETRGDADRVEITVDKQDLKSFIERTDLPTVQ